MKELKAEDYRHFYDNLYDKAERSYRQKDYRATVRFIELAARCMYAINTIYADLRLEELLKQVGDATFNRIAVKPRKNRCVILDTEGYDNRGLTQQYLRAMMKNACEILYIPLRPDLNALHTTINELLAYGDNASILSFEGKQIGLFEKTQTIIDAIAEFEPQCVFLHLMPWDCVSLMAINAIKGVDIYNINLTDHAYWLGNSFIDYNIEMRGYGRTVSVEKRALDDSQEINMPFYPITYKNKQHFDGFPPVPENAIIVFTGGSPYKMYGEDDFFFRKIVNSILNISERIYVMVAGFHTDSVEYAEKVKLYIDAKDRIFNIGIRKDIQEVFRHCDIYLSTYPILGGLMSQLAAFYGKPIVAMHSKTSGAMSKIEGFVNHYGNGVHTHETFEECMEYATSLINDSDFRKKEGEKIKDCLVTENKFAQNFRALLDKKQIEINFDHEDIDYDNFAQLYVGVENDTHLMLKSVIHELKWEALLIFKGYRAVVMNILVLLAIDKLKIMSK